MPADGLDDVYKKSQTIELMPGSGMYTCYIKQGGGLTGIALPCFVDRIEIHGYASSKTC